MPHLTDDMVPVSPQAALREVGFWLERSRADTYRVKAYRKAADALDALGADDLEALAQADAWGQVPGLGPKTVAVIRETLQGRVPDTLARLRGAGAEPLATSGLRSVVRGDLHSHTTWSDGGSPLPEVVITAQQLGHDYLAVTDHSPRLKVANGLSAARLTRQLEVVDAVNEHLGGDFRLLRGIEVDILDDGSLDQTEEMLARLDVRVASVHSKLAMDADAMTRRMVAAVHDPFTNVLGHCTGRLVTGNRGTRAQSQFDAGAVFEACAETGTAVEINSRPERRDPPTRLLQQAIDAGCLFSIDSDAHAPGQLDFQVHGCARAEELGLDPDRIVNTWPLERLLEWARPA